MLHKESFGKEKKIKKKSEILYIKNNGKKVTYNDFSIISKENILENDRIGILVSKKIGNAVYRNKIKRIFREIFRKEKNKNPPFYDILIQIRPGIKYKNSLNHEICFREWTKKSKTN